jgi:hypothetical protein
MFSASVWVDSFGPEASNLDVTGSSGKAADEQHEFLIWECPLSLSIGDVIEMVFEPASVSNPRPEVFHREEPPSEPPRFPWSNPPTDGEVAALESRDMPNLGTRWNVAVDGRTFELRPDGLRQHVSLMLLWREHRPDTIWVRLSRKSLREIVARVDGEELFAEELPFGSRFAVSIGA